MKRIKVLLAVMEPPTNSSGLGTLWGKLSIGINQHIDLDFIAPAQDSCHATKNNEIEVCGTIREIQNPPLNRIASVKINDPLISGIARWFWLAIRAFTKIVEKLGLNRENEYLNWVFNNIHNELLKPELVERYDYLAVHIPSLELGERVYAASKQMNKKFILVIGDPQGWRNEGEFVPENPTLQQNMLSDCAALIISEPTFNNYYQKHFEIENKKVVFFTDCFIQSLYHNGSELGSDNPSIQAKKSIELLHWGAIADYRNPSSLVDAIHQINQKGEIIVNLSIAGPIYSKEQRKYAEKKLSKHLSIQIKNSYPDAKQMIADADLYVVLVCNRHMDNMPSKMVEGLGFKIPMLVIANIESAASLFVTRNRIGQVASPNSATQIALALENLISNYEQHVEAFSADEIQRYEHREVGREVGARLVEVLS